VGIGFSLPPYVIREADGGMEVDIIREALKNAGHDVEFVYLPNLRLPVDYAQGDVDCVVANAAYDLEKDSGRKVYPSNVTIAYQNFAMSLSEKGLVINQIKDLTNLHVLAFNNATKYLGPEFAAMARNNPEYSELPDQSLQVRMLYSERVEVVVSDKQIFLWWRNKVRRSNAAVSQDMTAVVDFHPIFTSSPRRLYFNNSSLRDAFNIGLDEIVKSGLYDSIISSYVDDVSSK